MMNREAARLGMKNTQVHERHRPARLRSTTAPRGTSICSRRADPRLSRRSTRQSTRIKEFRYNNITQPNRNRLLWLDPSVDGMKTGHTEAAGYCLIASSKRGGRRLLSVLLGSTSETARAQESQKLLNWGFQFFDSVKLHPAKPAGQGDRGLEGRRAAR